MPAPSVASCRATRWATRWAALAAATVLLAGCSGGDTGATPQPSPSPSSSSTPSSSPGTTVDVPPGTKLTEPGSRLSFGDTASVAYDPGKGRGTVLDLTVRTATRGRVRDLSAFDLDKRTRASTPYYVQVSVRNRGPATVGRSLGRSLGGGRVPLLGVNRENTLLPAVVFATEFRRCSAERLPKAFAPGDSFRTCLVYLAPDKGRLAGVSYRPDPKVAPITWSGEVAAPPKRGR